MTTAAAAIENLRQMTALLASDPSMTSVVEALRNGESATIDGAWGSAKSMALAALLRAEPKLLVVVLAHAGDVEAMADDIRSFGGTVPTILPTLEDIRTLALEPSRVASETFGRRLAVMKSLAGVDPPRVLISTMAALLQPLPSLERVRRNSRVILKGDRLSLDELLAWLAKHGWERRDAVELAGEYSVRGGILDVLPADREDPLRIEFFGDEVESIREFSIESQRSLREIERADITALSAAVAEDRPADEYVSFARLVPAGTWFALVEPQELKEEGQQYLNRLETTKGLYTVEQSWAEILKYSTVVLSSLPVTTMETACNLRVESVERFSGDGTKLREELDRTIASDTMLIVCHNEAETRRLKEMLAESRAMTEGRLRFPVGRLAAGFRWVSAGIVALSDNELFRRTDTRRVGGSRRFQGRAIESFLELNPGDYVVHLAHGIGIFRGMRMLDKNGQLEEHLSIEFADQTLVYVPASKIGLVQKYVGASQTQPTLSKIGGVAWERRKKAVQNAVEDLASDLIDVQAARASRPGIACPPDSEWQREFEASFGFVETDDQVITIEEIRKDMESPRPMDRLVCGDVGYGKTELAMRAAFKMVDFGKQVAVLAPTTVLAQQHLRTFRERMAEFPFTIEALTRFQTKGEQNAIVKRASTGGVDILIGTHRLLSADVQFQDLGLIIIDEEQRFGVEHKERLKKVRSQVDVLTLSATPIPRTLHSALLGIRDISNLQTPPRDRLAIETRISRFDKAMIRHAILREFNRDGQVYFVHNRVHDIHQIAEKIRQIVPEARIAIVHGQMADHEIEEGMVAFMERRADILLATTIIESGLDIPNANTIFIHQGDRYGLSDLHQLRGRVGRSTNRAYCYVLIDENHTLKADAMRRLKAIEEYSQLGAGFQIALRDLEIRGAGNILGAQQSGHIAAVGYELYCQLLENAVRARKKQPLRTFLDVTVELPWKAYLPQDYLPAERQRIEAYRRLANVQDLDELAKFRAELEDRFGPVPDVARNFLDLAELRVLAQIWQVESVRPDDDGMLVLTFTSRRRIETLAGLRKNRIIVADAKSAYVRVPPSQRTADGYNSILKGLLQPN